MLLNINQKENIAGHNDVVMLPRVIYFRSITPEMSSEVILRLERDVMCRITLCNSWVELMTSLSSILDYTTKDPLILIDVSMFEQTDATVGEIASMISTIHRCLKHTSKLSLGVVSEKSCNIETIKALQDYEVMGVIPCVHLLGYDRTLLALRALLIGQRYWPREIY